MIMIETRNVYCEMVCSQLLADVRDDAAHRLHLHMVMEHHWIVQNVEPLGVYRMLNLARFKVLNSLIVVISVFFGHVV